jgi:hypothetical protein
MMDVYVGSIPSVVIVFIILSLFFHHLAVFFSVSHAGRCQNLSHNDNFYVLFFSFLSSSLPTFCW